MRFFSSSAAVAGDVNGDGSVNTSDATFLLKNLADCDVTFTLSAEEDERTKASNEVGLYQRAVLH